MHTFPRFIPLAAASLLPLGASAVVVEITYQNLSSSMPLGLHNTPVWTAFHDGTFDLFDPGSSASSALEEIAELGSTASLDTLFSGSHATGLSMTVNDPTGPGPGVFQPGASVTFQVDLDPSSQRFLTFASMIVPSNDAFIGNGDPMGLELFDGSGMFLGDQVWTLTGENVWDAGTELNDVDVGGAFVVGADASISMAENGVVSLFALSGLDDAIGVTIPTSEMIGVALSSGDLFSISVTAVPEPSTYAFFVGLGTLGIIAWRRRRSRPQEAQ